MARKKHFDCGHKGFGQYCHRCKDEELKANPPVKLPPSKAGAFVKPASTASAAAAASKDMLKPKAPKVVVPQDCPIDLTPVINQPGLVRKTLSVLGTIKGGGDYRLLKGKRLLASGRRDLLSIPIGNSYRLLFRQADGSNWEPVEVTSHETYNELVTRGAAQLNHV